ncbi:hypothetical protein F4818DRAFT_457861 [Hypoxylon cercidicola]|nr:hypothetical protein F4818DRAFT_457861 [Hypoxylon cercidicola]
MEQPYLPYELWDKVLSRLRQKYNEKDKTDPMDELWDDKSGIGYHLSMPSPTTLLNFSLVSKMTLGLAQPKLYKTVVVRDNASHLRLLMAFIRDPVLGQYVENLAIFDNTCWENTTELCADVYDAFVKAQPNLILPTKLRRYIGSGLKRGRTWAIVALLIAFCPRVKQLNLVMSYAKEFPWKVLKEVTKVYQVTEWPTVRLLSTGHLSQLRKLRLATAEYERGYYDNDESISVTPIQLPNLSTLVCDFADRQYHEEQLTIIPHEIGLRRLDLTHPQITSHEFLNIFHQTPELRVLQIKLTDCYHSWTEFSTTLPQLGDALRGYGDYWKDEGGPYLETLIIHSGNHLSRSTSRIGSLRLLSNLKTLSIELSDLVGKMTSRFVNANTRDFIEWAASASDSPPLMINNELPTSLESLEIQYDYYDTPLFLGYLHDQVVAMITDDTRENLREVLVQTHTNGRNMLSYRRNMEDPCRRDGEGSNWVITTCDSQHDVEIRRALDEFRVDRYPGVDFSSLFSVTQEEPPAGIPW